MMIFARLRKQNKIRVAVGVAAVLRKQAAAIAVRRIAVKNGIFLIKIT